MTLVKSLLEDIHQFTHKEQGKTFFKALLQKDGRLSDINDFYRRIGMLINEFQVPIFAPRPLSSHINSRHRLRLWLTSNPC